MFFLRKDKIVILKRYESAKRTYGGGEKNTLSWILVINSLV